MKVIVGIFNVYVIISNLLIVDRMVKIGESAADKTPYGELTQRLVAGLIEDNLMTAVEDSMD